MQQKYTYLTFEQKLMHRTFAEQFEYTKFAVVVDLNFDSEGIACSSHWTSTGGNENTLGNKPNKEMILERIENLLRYRTTLGFPASKGARITYFDNQVTIDWTYVSFVEQYSLIEKISLVVRVVSTEREEELELLSQSASETAYIYCESLWSPKLSITVTVQRNHESMQCLFDQLREAMNRNGVLCVEALSWQRDENGYLLFDPIFCPLEISVDEFEEILRWEAV
tara:strand:- start:861 stop:1535 length:675 start_codon:yes stop_codon:yes gene_type:complete